MPRITVFPIEEFLHTKIILGCGLTEVSEYHYYLSAEKKRLFLFLIHAPGYFLYTIVNIKFFSCSSFKIVLIIALSRQPSRSTDSD